MFSATLAQEHFEDPAQQLLYNAFFHHGDALLVAQRYAHDEYLTKTEDLRAYSESLMPDLATLAHKADVVRWAAARLRAVIQAHTVWTITVSLLGGDTRGEQTVTTFLAALKKRQENAINFGSDDEESWFDLVVSAVEQQDYTELVTDY